MSDKPNRKRGTALTKFVREQCANFSSRPEEQCFGNHLLRPKKLFRQPGECWVLKGQPCKYFEQAVLGPADYPYRAEGYDYAEIFFQYGHIAPGFADKKVKIRQCECGTLLGRGKQHCPKCLRKRRLESYRRKREERKTACATI